MPVQVLNWFILDQETNKTQYLFTFTVVLSLVIDIVSILLDIIVLAVWYPHEAKSSEQFSAVMAIFNLIFR